MVCGRDKGEKGFMRYLPEVIDKILTVIPATEVSMIRAFESVKSSAAFSAPENIGMWWRRGAGVMSEFISQDESYWSDWQREVVKIWMNEEKAA